MRFQAVSDIGTGEPPESVDQPRARARLKVLEQVFHHLLNAVFGQEGSGRNLLLDALDELRAGPFQGLYFLQEIPCRWAGEGIHVGSRTLGGATLIRWGNPTSWRRAGKRVNFHTINYLYFFGYSRAEL